MSKDLLDKHYRQLNYRSSLDFRSGGSLHPIIVVLRPAALLFWFALTALVSVYGNSKELPKELSVTPVQH